MADHRTRISPTAAPWWQQYVDTLRPRLTASVASDLAAVFGDPADFTDLADLLMTHEATHLFHEIHPVTFASEFPADWVMELFANLGMYGFLATHEPDALRLLSTLADATIGAGSDLWAMQDLELMGESMYASTANYVWYEFRLIRFAERLWNAGGDQGLRDYQRMLGHPDLSHDQVLERLSQLDTKVAESIQEWPDA